MTYYDPHYEDTYVETPETAAGETRTFPDCEGLWKLVSTGETVNAIEQTDIYGDPIFTIFIGEEGPLYSIDMEKETFEKL